MIDWFKKHRVLFALICVVILLLLMGVPFVINILNAHILSFNLCTCFLDTRQHIRFRGKELRD